MCQISHFHRGGRQAEGEAYTAHSENRLCWEGDLPWQGTTVLGVRTNWVRGLQHAMQRVVCERAHSLGLELHVLSVPSLRIRPFPNLSSLRWPGAAIHSVIAVAATTAAGRWPCGICRVQRVCCRALPRIKIDGWAGLWPHGGIPLRHNTHWVSALHPRCCPLFPGPEPGIGVSQEYGTSACSSLPSGASSRLIAGLRGFAKPPVRLSALGSVAVAALQLVLVKAH